MTRKIWLILAAFWLILAACTRMPEEALPAVAEGGVVEGERVTVTFTVPGFSPATKGLGDGGTLNTLHLAVFGGSGYLKEYVEATITGNGSYSYTVDDEEHIVPSYTYSADLVMSDSPRTIHFIGNGPATLPFGYAPAVMPMQLSANGEMGYWQMLYLEHGIRAKRNDDGDFVDKDGNVIPDGGTGYIADETTSAALQGIVLIRNWSKIVLRAETNSNFTPISFAVVNVPARGALAPYSADTGFIENYQSRDFTYLDQTVKYPANLPPGTSFDATIPSAAEFINASGDRVADATQPNAAVYLYERPAPSDRIPPSFVIVYGTYHDPDTGEDANYFYKVDLMETRQESETEWVSRYYPLFRNFKYQIIIQKIASRGHNTPAAAAASAGSADVSADVTTSHLSDISDGIGRLHVTPWMAKTFTKAHGPNDPVNDLNVILTKRVSNEDVIDTNTGSVTVKTLPPEDGGPDIIQNLSIAAPDEEGWRRISFQTVAPGRAVRTQSIRITGTHETGRLYRDVIISIQPIQPMSVECSNPRMALEKGEPQVIKVNIPDGLVESMFPLDFIIEAEDMTLTPDNSVADNNLPVESGTSISEHSDYAGKPAFYFIKTVTWDEYFSLPRHEDDEEMMWRSFTASFKTNCEYNGTTVWVYNEFFDKASVTFTNFAEKYFKKLGFTVPVPEQTGVDLPLYFELIKDPDGNYPPDYPEILVRIKGLTWKSSDGVSPGPEPGTYIYRHDVASPNVTLSFTSTTSDPDEIEVYLTADEYDPGYVKVYRFPYASMVDGHPMRNTNNDGWSSTAWSNVAWGHVNSDAGKNILFGYKDHPDKLNTPVTLTITSASNVSTSLTFPFTPTGPRNTLGDKNYHEIELKTKGNTADVDFELSSPGYVPVRIKGGRFQGNIRTMKVTTSNVIKKGNTYNFTKDTPTFTYSEDNGNCRVTFDRLPEDPYGAITLKAGQTYTMTIESLNSGQNLFYVDMFFNNSGDKVLCPESFQTNDGTIARYYGSNNQYVWNIPQGCSSVTTSITAPADRDVKLTTLYIKAFNGTLLDNGMPNNQ